MKIYVANVPQASTVDEPTNRGSGYCGVTACLLEGLKQLGFAVTAAHDGLHVYQTGQLHEQYDLYVVQRSMQHDQSTVFRELEKWGILGRTAFIDGFDYVFGPDYFWLKSPVAYFQKENLGRHPVHTLPFGIEDRFIRDGRRIPAHGRANARVMFAHRYQTHADRPVILRMLQEAGMDVVWRRIEDPPETRGPVYWQTGGRHNASYYGALDTCRVGVAAEGEAVDTLRYWEFAASGAVLVSPRVEQIITGFPDPPTPGVHYVPYDGPEEVVDAVRTAIDRYDEVIEAQREFFLSHHRSVHRAKRLLSIMAERANAIVEPATACG
ncbi:MAG: glycosyltransferase family 1 protein [Phycisphaerales bacterium]|nr:glycosyltransferase family 1 protein [Phycisphaerales bacterium]